MESHNLMKMLVMHFYIYLKLPISQNTYFLSIPQPSHSPNHHPQRFCLVYMYFCTRFRNLNKKKRILGIFCESVGRDKGGLSPSLKDGCSTQGEGSHSQTINPDRPKTQSRHLLKILLLTSETIKYIKNLCCLTDDPNPHQIHLTDSSEPLQ